MILLDTHVLLWWSTDSRHLTAAATAAMRRASKLLVSPLSLFAIGRLVALGRIALDRPVREWCHDLLLDESVALAPLGRGAAVFASSLEPPFPPDPVDRLLYGTALDAGVPFVTKDRAIRAHAAFARDVRVIW